MSLDLQAAAHKRMRRGLFTLAAIVVVLAVIVVLLLVFGGGTKNAGQSPSGAGSGSGAGQPTPAAAATPSDGAYAQPKDWVKLPEGAATANGLPVKFPKTEAGAAAMMVSVVRASWRLEAADIEKAVVTYSLPKEAESAKAVAQRAAAENRKAAGLPTEGTLPQDASFSPVPLAVKWQRQDDTHVKVWVNIRLVTNPGTGAEPKTRLVAIAGTAVWDGSDWKEAFAPPGKLPEPFDLGDEGFNRVGWIAILEDGRR
ncbi:hypothetical protein [Streptomyces sp. URMC 123]|uniref:hypothetical protein n=1 Tax=Streptomyces sp. URMC 123 TaxID=3423403 RepID=UPI003F1CE492